MLCGRQIFRRVFENRNGIAVSTIHGTKGDEFETVIAYALLEGMVPNFNDPDQQDSAKKRLYVIASRARKNLHLISERGRMRGGATIQIVDFTQIATHDLALEIAAKEH
jgi:DNA helicase-2/ATP-dependent DNA helicase PcrA